MRQQVTMEQLEALAATYKTAMAEFEVASREYEEANVRRRACDEAVEEARRKFYSAVGILIA